MASERLQRLQEHVVVRHVRLVLYIWNVVSELFGVPEHPSNLFDALEGRHIACIYCGQGCRVKSADMFVAKARDVVLPYHFRLTMLGPQLDKIDLVCLDVRRDFRR